MKNSTLKVLTAVIMAMALLLNSCSSDSPSPSAGQWKRKANFPAWGTSGAFSFVIGTKAYVSSVARLLEYDQSTDIWTQKEYLPVGMHASQSFFFVIGTKAYVGTGTDNASYFKFLYEYDNTTDTWTQKNDFPGGVRAGAIGFSIDNKGYVVGGTNGPSALKDVWEYNASADEWTKKSDFPGQSRYNPVSFVINGKAYYGTGSRIENNGYSYTKDFYEYNPATDTWTQKTDFPGVERELSAGFSIGNMGYAGTGYIGGGSTSSADDFWKYDPTTDKWTPQAKCSIQRFDSFAFAIGKKGYLSGGTLSDDIEYDRAVREMFFWEFTP